MVGAGDTAVTVWEIAKWPADRARRRRDLRDPLLRGAERAPAGLPLDHPRRRPRPRPLARSPRPASRSTSPNFSSYNATYGSIAGVIVFLVWLWISNLALLLGAEMNAELERSRELEAGDPGGADDRASAAGGALLMGKLALHPVQHRAPACSPGFVGRRPSRRSGARSTTRSRPTPSTGTSRGSRLRSRWRWRAPPSASTRGLADHASRSPSSASRGAGRARRSPTRRPSAEPARPRRAASSSALDRRPSGSGSRAAPRGPGSASSGRPASRSAWPRLKSA